MLTILLIIVAITALAVAVLAALLLTRTRRHISALNEDLERALMHKRWHERLLEAIECRLHGAAGLDKMGCGPIPRELRTHQNFWDHSLPEHVHCPKCNHKGAEWHMSGHEGNPAVGIQCMKCLDVMGAPFWEILKLENQPVVGPGPRKDGQSEDYSDIDY